MSTPRYKDHGTYALDHEFPAGDSMDRCVYAKLDGVWTFVSSTVCGGTRRVDCWTINYLAARLKDCGVEVIGLRPDHAGGMRALQWSERGTYGEVR